MSGSGSIEVVETGLLNTVQDLGRPGLRKFGVGSAGAMDGFALAVANLMVGNPIGAAGIEVTTFPSGSASMPDGGSPPQEPTPPRRR